MASSSYSAELHRAGFHPKLRATVNAPASSCPLYLHSTLPPSFILDRFQLSQLHSEGRLGSYEPNGSTLVVLGERDLEAPVVRAGSASLLLRLRGASLKGKEREGEDELELEVEVPLHVRYQVPVQDRWVDGVRQDVLEVEMGWPVVFWACDEGQEPPPGSVASHCHSSDLRAPYPALSSSSLHFLQPLNSTSPTCPPFPNLPSLSIFIPTGVLSDLPLTETINFIAIWSGMIWVVWAAYKARKSWNTSARVRKEE